MEERNSFAFPGLFPPWGISEILFIFLMTYFVGFLFDTSGVFLLKKVKSFHSFQYSELFVSLVAVFSQTVVLALLVIYFVRIKHRVSFTCFGLERADLGKGLIVGVVGGFGIFLTVSLVMFLITLLLPVLTEPQPFARIVLGARSWLQLVFPLLVGGFFAPFAEELYFRGFVYPVFRSRYGVLPAILISSCFFSALHLDLIRFLPLFLGGVFLALIYERTGSLLPSVIAHSTWNITATVLVFNLGKAF